MVIFQLLSLRFTSLTPCTHTHTRTEQTHLKPRPDITQSMQIACRGETAVKADEVEKGGLLAGAARAGC